jgi:hypothetical protein
MAMYGRLVTALEVAAAAVVKQAAGRAVSLAMLGPDHEVGRCTRALFCGFLHAGNHFQVLGGTVWRVTPTRHVLT